MSNSDPQFSPQDETPEHTDAAQVPQHDDATEVIKATEAPETGPVTAADEAVSGAPTHQFSSVSDGLAETGMDAGPDGAGAADAAADTAVFSSAGEAVTPAGQPATHYEQGDAAEPPATTALPVVDPVEGSAEQEAAAVSQGGMSTGKKTLIAAIVVLGLGGLVYGADLALSQGSVARGTTVAGVEVSGLNREEATQRLHSELDERVTQDVTVTAADTEVSTVMNPAEAGLSMNWEATVDRAMTQPLNPWTRLSSLFITREIGIESTVDTARFEPAVAAVASDLTQDSRNATVLLVDDSGRVVNPPQVRAAEPEIRIDNDDLAEALKTNWLSVDQRLAAPAGVSAAAISTDAAQSLLDDTITPALDGNVTLHGPEDASFTITPEQLSRIMVVTEDGSSLRFAASEDTTQETLSSVLLETEQKAANASVTLSGVVTEAKIGREVNWAELAEGFDTAVTADPRELEVPYEETEPTFTTEQAENATFNDTVGSFTTSGFSYASGVNIRLVAQTVNGAFVAPGETFSLNDFTGPRGTAQGYVESGIIQGGRAGTAVGGGISQFATTLYNAAYFAGMEDVAHTAHSFYISRYPAGREATVFEGSIDLQFKNTSDHPVIIVASADSSSVTVTLRGVKTVEVESVNGGRWNYTSPPTLNLTGPTCIASGGSQGFTTSDTRIITDIASGREVARETQTTVYDPAPNVNCIVPQTEDPEDEADGDGEGDTPPAESDAQQIIEDLIDSAVGAATGGN